MNVSIGRQGLWSLPGDGVLARHGDLILLSAIDERGLLDHLLDLLAKTSETGGDGRRFVNAVEDLVEGDETWGAGGEGQPGPAVVAFGPVGAGLAVTVSGTAWAEITTAHGTDRLAAAQPATVLRCVVGIPVYAVRGGLGAGRGGGDRTDRFSHLERGSIRAGGLSYHSGLTAMPVAAAPQGMAAPGAEPPLAPDVTALDVAGPDLAAAGSGPAAEEAGAWEEPHPMEPPAAQPDVAESAAAWAEAAEPQAPEAQAAEPDVAEPWAAEAEAAEAEAVEPGVAEPGALEPEVLETEAFEPEAMEPTALPEADQFHPPTGKSQIPDHPPTGESEIPDHPPTGKSEIPDHPPTGKSQIPDFEAAVPAEQPSAEVPPREATGAGRPAAPVRRHARGRPGTSRRRAHRAGRVLQERPLRRPECALLRCLWSLERPPGPGPAARAEAAVGRTGSRRQLGPGAERRLRGRPGADPGSLGGSGRGPPVVHP